MLRSCLAALAALALLGGSGSDPALAGKKNDTLVWATDRENPIADPYYINTRELVVIGHHVWDTLVLSDPNTGEIKPLLATKWNWANTTTLEMELRKGVKFHSGAEMTADDVVYTLNFVADKEHAIMNFALLAWIKNVEKLDAYKVRIHLHRPFPPALAYLAGLGFIMQKGHYDNAPTKADGKRDYGAVTPNGTGPYRISEMKPGDFIHMVRFKDYFTDGYKGAPKIGQIRFRTIKDPNTRIAELMTGNVDWLWDVPKDQAEKVQLNPAITVTNAKTLRVAYLAFELRSPSAPAFLKDKRVRQAITHAINREAIAKNLVGPASTVIHSACHPDQFACSSDVTKYAYDPVRAKALLKEAGIAEGTEVELVAYREREFTEAVIGDLVKVGLRPHLNFLQYTAFIDATRGGKAPIAHGTWGSNSVPDVSAITAHFFSGGPDDRANDAEVIRGIGEADAQTDPARRAELWKRVLRRIADEALWVPLYTYAKYYAYSKDLDFTPTSDEIPPFYHAKWR